jgi:hypothetical protein
MAEVFIRYAAEMAHQGISPGLCHIISGIHCLDCFDRAQKGNAVQIAPGRPSFFTSWYLSVLAYDGSFNDLFLVYVVITSLSFFLLTVLLHLPPRKVKATL